MAQNETTRPDLAHIDKMEELGARMATEIDRLHAEIERLTALAAQQTADLRTLAVAVRVWEPVTDDGAPDIEALVFIPTSDGFGGGFAVGSVAWENDAAAFQRLPLAPDPTRDAAIAAALGRVLQSNR